MSFQSATRPFRREIINQQANSTGGLWEHSIPQVGLLSCLWVTITLGITVSHASATSVTLGDYLGSLFVDRIRLIMNGTTDVVDTGLRDQLIDAITSEIGAIYDLNFANDSSFAVPAVASSGGTLNNIEFTFKVPVTLENNQLVGLLLMQNNEITASLKLDLLNPLQDGAIYKNLAGYTLALTTPVNVSVAADYFSVPAKQEDYPALGVVCQTLTQVKNFSATGRQTYDIPRGAIMTKMFALWEKDGSALADDLAGFVSQSEISYNQSETPFYLKTHTQRSQQRHANYGRALPAGALVWDWNNEGVPSLGSMRDYLDTSKITDLVYLPTLAGSFTTMSLRFTRKQLVPMSR